MQVVAATELKEDYLDSTDHIAYQYSNLIQPHVLFLNVNRYQRVILNVSTNVESWLGVSAADLVGRELTDDLFSGITGLLDSLDRGTVRGSEVVVQSIAARGGIPLLCRVATTPTRWMIEFEPEDHVGNINVGCEQLEQLLLDEVQSLSMSASVQEIVEHATNNLRNLLGYERGMCYRFDEENNGEVIAESTSSDRVTKYVGLRFPARDVPRTAREMLVACPLRTTMDQQLECCQIFPSRDPESKAYLDLTPVRGRGAAGSCREFYLNMNIRSTLVLPLIVNNRLWGLLSFHDHEVKRVSPKLDKHLQSIAKCVSISIERSLQALHEQARKQGQQVIATLTEVDSTSNQWLRYIQSRTEDLKNLVDCGGFLLRLSGEVLVAGTVPDASVRSKFIDSVWSLIKGETLKTNCLVRESQELGHYTDVAAGAIAVPLSTDFEDIAIWIRPEQKQTLHWAGDPLANIAAESSGRKRLNLRDSFDVWTRITQNKCFPWADEELSIAASASRQLGLLVLSWRAAQASHVKTQFLSCMSHEIRTPMTAILGYVNLLKEQGQASNDSCQAADYIDVIERNSHHLLCLIDDILNLAKIEAGKLTVELLPVPIADLLADVVSLIKVQAEIKMLAFGIEFETPIPKFIHSDPVRLRQILLNLLGNAFKFTEKGRITLKVGFDSSTRQIYFEVVDTGIGLTEAQISRLFNAFSQADASTTRRFGGSGLGLQISKNLAQLLGGSITVRSAPGKGSCFRVTLASGCTEVFELIHELESTRPVGVDVQVVSQPQSGKTMPSLRI